MQLTLLPEYIAYANTDDGSCVFEPAAQAAIVLDANGDGEIGSADLLDFLVAFGCLLRLDLIRLEFIGRTDSAAP